MVESQPLGGLTPPLSIAWRSNEGVGWAAVGTDSIYGIRSDGKIIAFNVSDGSKKWESTGLYLPNRLVCQGSRLFAYQKSQGLAYVDDLGNSAGEHLALSFGATLDAYVSSPVADDSLIYLAVNQGLYAWHQDEGLQFGATLSSTIPHTIARIQSREIVLIDGKGNPLRYHVSAGSFDPVWVGEQNGLDAGQLPRPYAVGSNVLVVGVGAQTVAYDLTNGRIKWVQSLPAGAFAISGDVLYGAFNGANVWAVKLQDGSLLWQRQYMYDIGLQQEYGLAYVDQHLYFGGRLRPQPDGAMLIALRAADGAVVWNARSPSRQWAGGVPLATAQGIVAYSPDQTGSYRAVPQTPSVTLAQISATPRPLRGPASSYGTGTVTVNLSTSAQVTIAAYRERDGMGTTIANHVSWASGNHEVTWNPGATGGFTSNRQFGYLLFDIREDSGLEYTQALVMPVNAFPDILSHWARANIEIMAYLKYVSGYEDLTFRPDNLVTRAESCTIIAKTLHLDGPSPGFKTKLTDIASHWARNYIMALEERGVIGGFAEPDGTFTFRPELNMTRAQEARILTRAYSISSAPPGFATKFSDISGHWAEADIKALEAAGYVNGFRESDGTFTFRPEQNLTRAELCTVVVRVLQLSP